MFFSFNLQFFSHNCCQTFECFCIDVKTFRMLKNISLFIAHLELLSTEKYKFLGEFYLNYKYFQPFQ